MKDIILTAEAHCDVPCGIYDPIIAQIAALSVIRMVDLINALDTQGKTDHNSLVRYIQTKEREATKCKDEIAIIWGDFIKPAHLEHYTGLHSIVHKIMSLSSAAKQHVSREKADELLKEVNKFSEIFWEIKNVPTKRAICPYLPSVEVVYPLVP
ncbi:MAG: superoxide dismutase, Ni [Campylobacteraceae bacterium]|jgi:nickel superoxide dismutase|nr:superoxide dismutase, Ni [Campylobacteraceae bacterium]